MPKLTPAQIDIATELGPDGFPIGRDPRRMTQDELRAIGHEPMPLLEVVRARCLDCCGGSAAEVRKCMAPDCRSWPYRLGTNEWRPPPSEAQREHTRSLNLKIAQKSTKAPTLGDSENSSLPAAPEVGVRKPRGKSAKRWAGTARDDDDGPQE